MGERVTDVPAPPPRPAEAHKGTFGTVIIGGGSPMMIGAPALAATAALRTGCGLCKIMTWPDLLPHCLTIEPSATGLAVPYVDDPRALEKAYRENVDERTVIAMGPGMSMRAAIPKGIIYALEREAPVVLDADALNNLALAGRHQPQVGCPLVMTPHPGEYRRLAASVGIEHDPTEERDRPAAATALAERFRAVVVLKGHRTVVADGERQYINTTGNPALATAGSGDVLTGMIASLMAQGMGRFEASVLAVYVHGLAADLWAEQNGPCGLTARDLAGLIPRALHQHRTASS